MDNTSDEIIIRRTSRIPVSFGAHMGIWSVILCLGAGLVMKMRPLVILGRAIIVFAIAGALGYVLALVIQKCAAEKTSSFEAQKSEPQDENSISHDEEPQNDQEAQDMEKED